MRLVGDPEADTLVEQLFARQQSSQLYAFLELSEDQVERYDANPALRSFLLNKRMPPTWYNAEQAEHGQQFFKKYALDIMTLLGALPYCYAASPGNKAIYFSEKMRQKPGKRLLETAQFIIAVMDVGSFREDGKAIRFINKTRLVHALVRYSLQAKSPWDIRWGVPVNQEDMAGTNLAFSYIIVQGLVRSCYAIQHQEVEDFLHAWRYVGYQLNIHSDLLPASFAEAKVLEKTIKDRHIKKSAEGSSLTHDLIQHYKTSFPYIPAYLVDGQIRYFLGPEISSIVGLYPDTVKDTLVIGINKLKERINRIYTDPDSYKKMLRNHAILKAKYA